MKNKLTGKCLEAFKAQNKLTNSFSSLPQSCQNALIIEFFDSTGIYIGITNYSNYFRCWVGHKCINIFKSRTEATNAAIEKANTIYNEN